MDGSIFSEESTTLSVLGGSGALTVIVWVVWFCVTYFCVTCVVAGGGRDLATLCLR